MNMNYYQISAEELGKNAKVPLLSWAIPARCFMKSRWKW